MNFYEFENEKVGKFWVAADSLQKAEDLLVSGEATLINLNHLIQLKKKPVNKFRMSVDKRCTPDLFEALNWSMSNNVPMRMSGIAVHGQSGDPEGECEFSIEFETLEQER